MKFPGWYRPCRPKFFCQPRIIDKITRSSWDNRAFFILTTAIICCLFYIMTFTQSVANTNNSLSHKIYLVHSEGMSENDKIEEDDDNISSLETSNPMVEVTKSRLNYSHEKNNIDGLRDRTSYSTAEVNDSGDKEQNDVSNDNSDEKSSKIPNGVDLLDQYYNATTITIILVMQFLLWVAYYKMDQNHRLLYNECL